jgi:tetratricopeptide (TPR) repeat protein
VDVASLDLVRYLGRHWKRHGIRVLLLLTVRSERLGMQPELVAELADLERDLPVTRVELQTLSEEETIRLIQAMVVEGEDGANIERSYEAAKKSEGKRRKHSHAHSSAARSAVLPSPEPETPLIALGCWLFEHTGGHPFYLLEMLKMFRDRGWLVPRQGADGNWKLEFSVEMASEIAQVQSERELLPASVRVMILARQAKLTPAARELVMAGAVLGNQATAPRLWQVAKMSGQVAMEALEEAIRSGILREKQGSGGRRDRYRFAHDLMRDVIYTEMGEARRHVLHQRAFTLLHSEGARASKLAYHARASGDARAAYRYSMQAGDEAMAVFAIEDATLHYKQARSWFSWKQELQAVLAASEVEHLYLSLAQAYSFLSEWGRAQESYEELINYGQQQGLPTLVSMSLNRLALLVALQSNDKPKARALLMEAWRLAEVSQDQQTLAETQWSLALIRAVGAQDSKEVFLYGGHALELARATHHKELEARCLSLFGMIHTLGGNFQEALHCLQAALESYATLGNGHTNGQESVASVLSNPSSLPHMMSCWTEALCWTHLAVAQLNCGQVQDSIRSSRRALSLAQEAKNVWVQLAATAVLTYSLQEAGANEEALALMQQAIAEVQTLPVTIHKQRFFVVLGSTYHALHQWEEARRMLEEAETVAETVELKSLCVPCLSLLCMNYAQAGEWELASSYALKAIAARKRHDVVLTAMDFYHHYETEALLRGGDVGLAREEVQRFGEGVGPYPRFRISYLRSLAVLATWDGYSEQASKHLCEAAQIAADLGLPTERWQIQAALGRLYEEEGQQTQARAAFGEAAMILQRLAKNIGDEARRASFLTAPQAQQVLQQAQGEALSGPVSAL